MQLQNCIQDDLNILQINRYVFEHLEKNWKEIFYHFDHVDL